MSRIQSDLRTSEVVGQKRKAPEDEAELEIDLNAPEPASKKALRKAKKSKTSSQAEIDLKADQDHTVDTASSKKAEHPGRTLTGIWIGNLPYTTTKADLQTFLTTDESHAIKAESISRINLPMTAPKHGKAQNKGFAYVDFTGAGVLEKALQLSEKLFLGRRVLIKDAKNFEGRPSSTDASKKESSGHPPNTRIFVGNLGFDTTVEDLETHFQACGPVSEIKMATFEDSGKCKGYAWVDFEQLSSAESAMRGWVEVEDTKPGAKSNHGAKRRTWIGKIEGRKLRMEYAEDRTTRYNKRFGKGARTNADPGQTEVDGIVEVVQKEESSDRSAVRAAKLARPNAKRVELSTSASGAADSQKVPSRDGRKVDNTSGYARETVDRLRGAMVPAEGKKVVFD